MSYKTIRVEYKEDSATVTLSRPEVRNAFGPESIREITAAFAELSRCKDLPAVVLRGEGKAFCAGADLSYMQAMAGFSEAENQRDAEELFDMFLAIRQCPVPTLAYVHGHAMGGGLGIVAAADMAFAEKEARFAFSEVRLGLVPAVISSFVLEKMQPTWARRLMLNAEVFSAETARTAGLVVETGGQEEMEKAIARQLTLIAAGGREAVRACKALIDRQANAPDWREARRSCSKVIAERRVSAEGQEGIRSHLEKREPSWKVQEDEPLGRSPVDQQRRRP